MAKLTGRQIGQLQELILDAFSQEQFEELLLVRLDLHLGEIVSASLDWKAAAREVIVAAGREGWTDDLLRAVAEARPRRKDIQALAARLLPLVEDTELSEPAAPTAEPVSPPPQPDKPGVQSGSTQQFQRRREPGQDQGLETPPAPEISASQSAKPEPKPVVQSANTSQTGPAAPIWFGTQGPHPDPEPSTWQRWLPLMAAVAVLILVYVVLQPSSGEVVNASRLFIAGGGAALAWGFVRWLLDR